MKTIDVNNLTVQEKYNNKLQHNVWLTDGEILEEEERLVAGCHIRFNTSGKIIGFCVEVGFLCENVEDAKKIVQRLMEEI